MFKDQFINWVFNKIYVLELPEDEIEKEETAGQIRATIGKARILMNKKGRFQQFQDLVKNCEFGYGEKRTTCTDLQVSN